MIKSKTFLFCILVVLFSLNVKASVPKENISKMELSVLGIYTTSDPTCQNGLIRTLPLNTNPQLINFLGNPKLGDGKVASPISCIIYVIKRDVMVTFNAGNYTGQTLNGNSYFSDAPCNPGGTITMTIQQNGMHWPEMVREDMASNSLPAGEPYRIFYLSTASKCFNIRELDEAVSGCEWSTNGNNPRSSAFIPPSKDGDINGIHIDQPEKASKYRMIVDIMGNLGGMSAAACGMVGPPKFSFIGVKNKKEKKKKS